MSSSMCKLVQSKIKEGVKSLPPLLTRQFTTPLNHTGHVVRVMQWNILAQALALGKDNFVRCPAEALHWGTRKYRLLEELLHYDCDIICLQEVDTYHYINEKLAASGYSGIFFPKVDSPCLYVPDECMGPDGASADGCAIFYQTSKYKLIELKSVPLQIDNKDTNQVTIMAMFQENTTNARQFAVAVTHLKAKKGFDDLRHRQGCDWLNKIKSFVGNKPVIVCGDFNATPDEPVYSAFEKSDLNLTSAYRVTNNDKEPEYTTWKIRGSSAGGNQTEYCRTIDYIWISRDKIEVVDCLKFPTGDAVGPDRIPSYSYASDHFSLVVDLCVK